MWGNSIAFLSSILLLHGTVSASTTKFGKRQITNSWNYNCGAKVFSQKFLDAAAELATLQLSSQVSIDSTGKDSDYPSVYKGPHRFGQKGVLLLWPLSGSGQVNSADGNSETYFLVLAEDVPLKPAGVIIHRRDNSDAECEAKQRVRASLPKSSETGYRCFSAEFSPRSIDVAVRAVYQHKKTKTPGIDVKSLPWRFGDGKSLFAYSGSLYAWPIKSDGRFYAFATTLVILNQDNLVIGMIEKKHGKNYPCKDIRHKSLSPQNSRYNRGI